jgi:hypothetical protein
MGYTGRIRGGATIFDGSQAIDGPTDVYFAKGGVFTLDGTPTFMELAAAISEPVHVCGGDVYLGGDMPQACGSKCLGVGGAADQGGQTVYPDGTTIMWSSDGATGLSTAMAAFAVLALAAFLGISSEISAVASARRDAPVTIRYGGVIKDTALIIAFQIMWNEIITQSPHPSMSIVFATASVYHWTHFATAAVCSGIVASSFNQGRLFAIGGQSSVPLAHALLGRAAFETICLLGVALVGPILPAAAFAAVFQLGIGVSITAIAVRDVCAAHVLCPSMGFGTALVGDVLLLLSVATGALLAVPFCADTSAVPVGLELTIAVALIVQVGAAASIFAVTTWGPEHSVHGGARGVSGPFNPRVRFN